ncbi:MAG: RagB/SusD family nutrient uptake outer membrane protein [Sediminibacterium sp.]
MIRSINIKLLSCVIFVILASGLGSCKKFLDERISKNTSLPLETTDQLTALMEQYSIFYNDENQSHLGTDDYGLNAATYDNKRGNFTFLPNMFRAFWDVDYAPITSSGDVLWASSGGEWRDIFYANAVLVNLEKVTGGTDEVKARLKADAHMVRAYAYWQLANTYCLPYTEANKGEMGLPSKKLTSFEEDLTRQTLEQTYKDIEADLQEALKINKPLIVGGRPEHWRSNTAAVNGFAARYYLNRNNYTEALKYANLALNEYNALVDYNNPTEMYYGTSFTYSVAGAPSFTCQFPYTHNNQSNLVDMIGWKEFLYFRMQNYGSWFYLPSQELLNLYDKANDRRYEFHVVENYSYYFGSNTPTNGLPGWVHFFKDRLPSGPTTSEMYLIKAECLARTGDVPGALAAVNTLRAKRIRPGATVNLTAANQAEAVTKILEERRREMPFRQRWFDLRRYNNNTDPSDDVVVTKQFYPLTIAGADVTQPVKTYTLEKNSRRYALPIHNNEILAGRGTLKQNTY